MRLYGLMYLALCIIVFGFPEGDVRGGRDQGQQTCSKDTFLVVASQQHEDISSTQLKIKKPFEGMEIQKLCSLCSLFSHKLLVRFNNCMLQKIGNTRMINHVVKCVSEASCPPK